MAPPNADLKIQRYDPIEIVKELVGYRRVLERVATKLKTIASAAPPPSEMTRLPPVRRKERESPP
jgi:hypothetical protein